MSVYLSAPWRMALPKKVDRYVLENNPITLSTELFGLLWFVKLCTVYPRLISVIYRGILVNATFVVVFIVYGMRTDWRVSRVVENVWQHFLQGT